jgi:hypothetical protein
MLNDNQIELKDSVIDSFPVCLYDRMRQKKQISWFSCKQIERFGAQTPKTIGIATALMIRT